ncbi:MAG: hypothetical protein HQL90_15625 [Magnetococcales bacterium]|nr:hypothetical protein [Magnetococcales bacterium]
MAAPNLINPTALTSRNGQFLLTTSDQAVVANAAASGTVVKISSLYIANIHATDPQTVTVTLNDNGTARVLLNAATVPVNCTLVVIDKESPVNLEENDSLQVKASNTNALNAIVSYEVMA